MYLYTTDLKKVGDIQPRGKKEMEYTKEIR